MSKRRVGSLVSDVKDKLLSYTVCWSKVDQVFKKLRTRRYDTSITDKRGDYEALIALGYLHLCLESLLLVRGGTCVKFKDES